jgi:cell division protein FtsX
MYFLTAAINGMQRRWLATSLVSFGGVALLSAAGAIFLWSFWLSQENANLTTKRTASAFLDTADDAVVAKTLQSVLQVRGVENARIISATEFNDYLKNHFPTLADLVTGLGADVIPRMIEVTLSQLSNASSHAEILADIQSVPQVLRVDDGSARVEKALNSIHWLSMSGMGLAIGLWAVLFIVCLGHYQSALHASLAEMQLLRSFGATKLSLLLPWTLEAILQSLLTGILSVLVLFFGKTRLLEGYNDFFGTIGFEPLQWSATFLPITFLAALALALSAHLLGGSIAFFRSKLV